MHHAGPGFHAAREVDDAAVGFVRNSAQIGLLELSVQAAQRSLEIATVQYREGLVDFQRVLDSQKTLFSQQERLYAQDPGAISLRRLEIAQSTRIEARSHAKRAEADLRKARESAGDSGEHNARLLSARAAIEEAELDLARTTVFAPVRGRVTDLRVEAGHFAQAGAPPMTLLAADDLWISADMTENNLGHIDPGDAVAIALDAMPGRVLMVPLLEHCVPPWW